MKTRLQIAVLFTVLTVTLLGCANNTEDNQSTEDIESIVTEQGPVEIEEEEESFEEAEQLVTEGEAEDSFPNYWYNHMDEAFNFDYRHFHTVQGMDDYATDIHFYTDINDYMVTIKVNGNSLEMIQVGTTAYLYTSLTDTWVKLDGVEEDGYVDMLGMGDTKNYEESISDFVYSHTEDNCDYFVGTVGTDEYMFCLNRSLFMCTSVITPVGTINIDLDTIEFPVPDDSAISETITDHDEIVDAYQNAMVEVMMSGVPGVLEAVPVEGAANEE